MVSNRSESGRSNFDGEEENLDHGDLRYRMTAIQEKYREYCRITLDDLGVASEQETNELLQWALDFSMTGSEIAEREKWYESDYKKRIASAYALNKKFMSRLSEAQNEHIISETSMAKWIARFRSRSVSYKEKEYWVLHQMPHYIQSWKNTAEDREKLSKQKGFDELCQFDSRFAVISKKEAFLDLHYDKRKDLLAAAKAALLASNVMQSDLYAKAESRLKSAAAEGILSYNKVGQWLERIFTKKADPTRVMKFVEGNGSNDLETLMRNWRAVRERYDAVTKTFKAQGQDELPRGIHLVSESQFLGMHYASRMHYVEEMERRLQHGSDLSKESTSFVKIRHAIDTKDWGEAALLIEGAKKEGLSPEDRARLDSMRRYVSRFAKQTESADLGNVMSAKARLDELLHQVPSSMQPMVTRLLRGPHANRSINQFRWIVYNNKWCRAHGYLTYEKATKGASQDHEKETKYRKEHGLDTGINDSIGHETADQAYFRDKEFANHKATYLHINLGSGAPNTLAEWLEHERDPKVLYWTTFCGHEDGMPMADNWHNDLFHVLTEMRSLTKTIGNAGYLYRSPNQNLVAL